MDDPGVLVADSVSWAGQRGPGFEKGKLTLRGGELDVHGFAFGAHVQASSCSLLGEVRMPEAKRALEVLEEAEAMADGLFREGSMHLSRVDLARDIDVPEADVLILEAGGREACRRRASVFGEPRRLGVTFFELPWCDRVRVYHKGIETREKRRYTRVPADLAECWRTEVQLRTATIPEPVRGSLAEFWKNRWRRDGVGSLEERMPVYVRHLLDAFLVGAGLACLVPEAE